MSIGIYKITNPNGKVYIGQSVNVEKRLNGYKSLNNCNKQLLLHRSLKKYGSGDHIFEIIEECSLENLNIRERHWQDFFEVLDIKKGLNCKLTSTFGKSGKLSQDVKNKIGLSNTGKIKHSVQNKINISQRSKLQKNMLGKNHSDKTKSKISNSKIGKKDSEETKINKSKAATGKIKTQEHKNNISLNHPTKKPIMQLDLSGFFIREYISINEASRQTGYRVSDISACCNNKQKTAFGFIWIFK